MSIRVLVTGAGGFVGAEVLKQLSIAPGFEAVGVARRPGPLIALTADIRNPSDLARVCTLGRFDVVVNAAGLAHEFGDTDRDRYFAVNATGAGDVAKLAARLGARRFVHISSVAVYGGGANSPFGESSECRPSGAYAESKLEGERVVTAVCRANAVPLTILRPSTVVGEGDRGNVARLITSIVAGRFLMVGRGENRKSLVCKDDVARAVVNRILESSEPFEVFNVSAGSYAMSQIVQWIREECGKKGVGPRIAAPLATSLLRLGATLGVGAAERASKTLSKWLSEDTYAGDAICAGDGFSYAFEPEAAVRREARRQRESARTTRRS